MKSLILSEYLEDEKTELIMNTFNICRDLANECLNNSKNDLDSIRDYLLNKGNSDMVIVKCKCCGRKLSDPESVKRGYGSECYRKIRTDIYEDIFKGRE